ncbi:tyrosine-protein phosphatase non-receptor type 7-like [Musca vetustissima]|uniref:tyrosine-protein phosphatase non-receptor type 7-like n=1 Tax=Musca vetustissima TaxID=27455 RepID=UPI002AB7CD6F|nr:tyrosine-protein phosphatase non-receptor type 7-like [Musca vetustissima]
MRKRQKQTSYSQRCRPVSLDEYAIDNGSIGGGSIRKGSAFRSSKRTYGNLAFDDPSIRHNALGVHDLAKFATEKLRIFEEFRDVPQITARDDEVPPGCEDKNRYANVLPLPETRVILQRLNDDEKTEYINANYVSGPKDSPNYYIACQAPLETTVEDFWRMIWEQQSRVIIQATDLIENGVEKCAEYLPPSVTLDNHASFGDFQVTLQNREVKDKYAISTIVLKNTAENNASRELTHYWYKWPETGVPAEEAPIIAMLLEARSSLISYANEQANEEKEKSSTLNNSASTNTLRSAEEGTAGKNGTNSNGSSNAEINGNISMVPIKKTARNQGPLTVHCSPGTGRTGTIIACDIAIRSLETPKRTVDIPHIVYYVRRGRASAVLTKEQYEFIYKVANMYAAKITNPSNYN